MLVQCCSLLDSIVLQDSVADPRFWKFDSIYGYIVKGLYNQLTYEEKHVHSPLTDIIRNKIRSIKVSLFTWWLLNKRTPTKDNLARHRTLHLVSLLYYGGCGKHGTINHLFMECGLFWCIWSTIFAVVENF